MNFVARRQSIEFPTSFPFPLPFCIYASVYIHMYYHVPNITDSETTPTTPWGLRNRCAAPR